MAKKTNKDRVLDLRDTDPTVRAVIRGYELELDSWEACMETLVFILARQKASLTQRLMISEFNVVLTEEEIQEELRNPGSISRGRLNRRYGD